MFTAYHKTNADLTNEILRKDLNMYLRSRKNKKYYKIKPENMTPKSKYTSFKSTGTGLKDKLVYLGASITAVEKAFSYIENYNEKNIAIDWGYVIDIVVKSFAHEVVKAVSIASLTSVIIAIIGALVGFSGGAINRGISTSEYTYKSYFHYIIWRGY
ncbi:MAG: hypothetical protein ACRC41_05695 [Sarcina sp.]